MLTTVLDALGALLVVAGFAVACWLLGGPVAAVAGVLLVGGAFVLWLSWTLAARAAVKGGGRR